MSLRPAYNKADRIYTILFIIVAIAGVVLRLYQHFSDRPLWEDEAHLALNFVCFGYKDLSIPLDHFQVAPILFIYITETVTRLFGLSEVALRSFPFFVSLLTYPLFYYVAQYITKSRLGAIVAFIIFSFSTIIIEYSSELKPYTIELSAYILLIYLLLSTHKFVAKNRYALLAFAGSLAMLTANASHVVLVCVGIYILASGKYLKRANGKFDKEVITNIAYMFGLWGFVFVLNFFTMIYKHPYSAPMRLLWRDQFLPANIFSTQFANFMSGLYDQAFFDSMLMFSRNWYFSYVLVGLFIVAMIYAIIKRNKEVFVFTVLPVILHLVLSMLHFYPLYYRFYLYLLPALIIMLSYGVVVIVDVLRKTLPFPIALIPVVYVVYCTAGYSISHFRDPGRDIRPCLAYINEQPGDMNLLVTTPATLYEFYQRMGKATNGNVENISWFLDPAQYYAVAAKQDNEYLLLCSTDGFADGYKAVIEDVRKKGLVTGECTYGTYTVLKLKPLP